MHDDRCEAHWNDGICACADRADNASRPWFVERPAPTSLIRKITTFLALHK